MVVMADNHNNDPLFNDMHDIYFEHAICMVPETCCALCDRFLFSDQVKHLPKNCHLPFWLSNDNNSECDLCSTCWNAIKKDTIPCIAAVPNQLFVSDPPQEFFISNRLERRLLSKIQVFMTVVILPGGQFAERGLLLNLPVDVEDIAEQLDSLSNLNQCMVKFEAGKAVGRSTRQMIRPHLVFEALQWLHENNILYQDIDKYEILKDLMNGDRRADDSFHEVDIADDSGGCDLDMEEASLIPADYPVQSHEETQAEEVGSCLFVLKSLSKPVSIYEVQSGEELAFPWLFPTGRFGYLHERHKKVSPHMYFKCWLYNYRGHWRKDISYLLHAATSYDLSLLKSAISMFLRVSSAFVPGTDTPLTAGYICTNPTDPRLIQNSYMFMKIIRGTVAYLRNTLNDLLAMVKTLDPPTLFMTLSSDDLHWPELGMMLEDLDYETAASKGPFGSSMRADPLYTALHFDRRFHALMKHVIHGPTQPLGKVVDYFYRVEFQNRGSAHYHMFFWVEGIPQKWDIDTQDEILKYIDRVICSNKPSPDSDPELYRLVCKLQTHQHTKYCRGPYRKNCQFKFPCPVCSKTKLHTNVNIIQKRWRMYETHRDADSVNINAFNPTILRHFRSNMDIQFVNNAESIAYYICAYICKHEPDELRNALGNLIFNVFVKDPSLTKYKKLWKIGTTVLKHRRLSAQEAAFRMSSNLHMVEQSRRVVYLNVRLPEKRYKMLRTKKELQGMREESIEIFKTNLLDYYRCRPAERDDMSLYYFAAWYSRCSPPKRKNTWEGCYP